jgi:hypothetical protein
VETLNKMNTSPCRITDSARKRENDVFSKCTTTFIY